MDSLGRTLINMIGIERVIYYLTFRKKNTKYFHTQYPQKDKMFFID